MGKAEVAPQGIRAKLAHIQQNLHAPKDQWNEFGGFNYRNLEGILEAVKPLLCEMGCTLVISDAIESAEGRVYVNATAILADADTGETAQTQASAREPESRKGMDGSQITGAASSYARKYALNGLFAIDDTRDADATNAGDDAPPQKARTEPQPSKKGNAPKSKTKARTRDPRKPQGKPEGKATGGFVDDVKMKKAANMDRVRMAVEGLQTLVAEDELAGYIFEASEYKGNGWDSLDEIVDADPSHGRLWHIAEKLESELAGLGNNVGGGIVDDDEVIPF